MPVTGHTLLPEDFFRELESRRTAALVQRDLPLLDALHAPDYQLITPAGKVFTKTAYLGAVEAAPFYTGWEAGPMAVRVAPGMAVVRYRARLSFPSGRDVHCWHTDSWELRDGQWQAVWSQATERPAQDGAP